MVVVDDHPLWRQTLRAVIERGGAGQVVGEAGDGETALELVDELRPDLVLMDIHLPGISGCEATSSLLERHPSTRVLVLSSSDERSTVLDAVRAGAVGYLLKTAEADEVYEAVRRVHRGELVFPPALAAIVLEELRSTGRTPTAPTPVSVGVVAAGALDREGLAQVLAERGFDVAVVASAVADLSGSAFDVAVAVLPSSRSDRTTADLLREIRQATSAALPVVVVVFDVDPDEAAARIGEAGTDAPTGYLLRDRVDDVEAFADAVRRVVDGEHVVDPAVAEVLVAHRAARSALDELTERERDVLRLMAGGRSNQAIAERLYVSGKSVESYVARIFSKLGLEVAPDDHRRVLAVVTYLRAAGAGR